MAGYSGTPLARKLGYTDGAVVFVHDMPASVRAEIERQASPTFTAELADGTPAAHVFVTDRSVLEGWLPRLRARIAPDASVWVSWPKQASGVGTDVTENVIRDLALPLGFVDVKVCAVDRVWSGLKLVVRRDLRTAPRPATTS